MSENVSAKGSALLAAQRDRLGDLEEFSFTYQDRLKIRLGTSNNLDYKLRLTARVVLGADGLAPTDRGTLDVSSMTKAGTINPVFSPGDP